MGGAIITRLGSKKFSHFLFPAFIFNQGQFSYFQLAIRACTHETGQGGGKMGIFSNLKGKPEATRKKTKRFFWNLKKKKSFFNK